MVEEGAVEKYGVLWRIGGDPGGGLIIFNVGKGALRIIENDEEVDDS